MNSPTRNESGLGGAEVLPFVVLVFVVGALVFAQSWTYLDVKLAATSAAREAARTFVEHRGPRSADAIRDAVEAAERVMVGFRVNGKTSIAALGAARLRRCERVTFEVTQQVQSVGLPWVRRPALEIKARASEIVDPFRHGLSGQAPCALP